jgi:hypothetical protein
LLTIVIHLPMWIWLWTILGSDDPGQGRPAAEPTARYGTWIGLLLNFMFLTSTLTFGVVMELRGDRATIGRSRSRSGW